MPVNNRLFWACEAVGFATDGSESFTKAHGVQSVGVTTTFNLEPVFELGEIKLYQNIENIPDVEMTMQKVLDGYPPLYTLATQGALSASLTGRGNKRCAVALSLFPDTNNSASGVPVAQLVCSGMFPSSLSYTFPVEGNCTEDMTMVGNNAIWKGSDFSFSGGFNNDDEPLALTYGSGGVQRRQHVRFTQLANTVDANGQVNATKAQPSTILPPDVAGINSSGINPYVNGVYGAHVQNITCSVDLGRDAIYELGRRGPYFRYITFPVQVTTEIEIISISGSWVSANQDADNVTERTIKVSTTDGLFLDLGLKNVLSNVAIGGGDTGGANQTITYTYSTYNDFTVQHDQDPTSL